MINFAMKPITMGLLRAKAGAKVFGSFVADAFKPTNNAESVLAGVTATMLDALKLMLIGVAIVAVVGIAGGIAVKGIIAGGIITAGAVCLLKIGQHLNKRFKAFCHGMFTKKSVNIIEDIEANDAELAAVRKAIYRSYAEDAAQERIDALLGRETTLKRKKAAIENRFEQARRDEAAKRKGVFRRCFNAVKRFFSKIGNWFRGSSNRAYA